jgi:hypothetical protein
VRPCASDRHASELADPHHPSYTTLASADLADSTLAYLTGSQHARDIELAGTHRATPPMSPSELPVPAEELASWVVLHKDGRIAALPGLEGHGLLAASSAMAAARAALAAGLLFTSFLWPLGGRHAPDGRARITVLPTQDLRVHLTGMVLVSSPSPGTCGADATGAGGPGIC